MRRVSERARLSSCTLKEEEWWWVVEKRPRFFKVESEEEEETAAGTKLFLSFSLSLSLSFPPFPAPALSFFWRKEEMETRDPPSSLVRFSTKPRKRRRRGRRLSSSPPPLPLSRPAYPAAATHASKPPPAANTDAWQ